MKDFYFEFQGCKYTFKSEVNIIFFEHKNGVKGEYTIPKDWATTRIMQFITTNI